MSTILNGNPANVTGGSGGNGSGGASLSATVSALANNGSGAIRVTTSAPHLFGPGDTIVMVTTVLAGVFAITVIDSTHFDLVGSTFTATATGVAVDVSLTPQVKLPTDGDTFSLQLSGMLSGLQACLDRDQYLNKIIGTNVANQTKLANGNLLENWGPEFNANTFSSGTTLGIAWDPLTSRWILGASNNSTGALETYVSYGLDGGATAAWIAQGSFTPANTADAYGAVCADASTAGSYWFAYTDGVATHNHFFVEYWNGSAWSQVFGPLTATGYLYGVAIATLGGYVSTAVAGNGSNDSFIQSTNNHGGSWSTPTVAPTLATGASWRMKSNGSQIVAVPSTSNAVFNVYTSTDGHTFASNSGLASILTSGNTVVGLAWTTDAIGPCWLVAVNPASGTPFWVRSSDGVNWQTQKGGVSATMTVTDMAAVGGVLACTLADASSGGPSGAIYSVDGGVTWYFSQAAFSSNTTPLGANPSRVVSSPMGFFAANGIFGRFSGLAGLPPVAL